MLCFREYENFSLNLWIFVKKERNRNMGGQKKCCVPKCDGKSKRRFRFPHPFSDPHRRYDLWIKVINNRELWGLDPIWIYQSYRVCGEHFSPHRFVTGTENLKKNAIPDVNLPGDGIESGEAEEGIHPGPSTAAPLMEREAEQIRSPSRSPKSVSGTEKSGDMSCSSGWIVTPVKLLRSAEESASLGQPSRRSLFPTESSERTDRREGVLQSLGVRKLTELSPKARRLFKSNQLLKRSISRSSKRVLSFKKRLQAANKAVSLGYKDCIPNLSPTVSSFLQCQVREAGRKGKGHRFTLNDKVFALALLKRSGRAYNFLSKVFVLPARRTLLRLLSSLSFSTGINDDMFDHLSVIVKKKVKDIDRHCILMFDEMSLTSHLDYSEHIDLIEGFEDLGGGLRTKRFADKALVFMIRGLKRKYKQPVVYVFPSGGIKTPVLCKLIKTIVLKLTHSGFRVSATVCDQGASNVAAINKLCAETRESVLRQGGEYRGEYFLVNGSEVIPLFDPPHLLKGVRNGLLDKDLKFCRHGVNKVASWRHILQVYAIDNVSNRAVPRLTEHHVVPAKIKKMKVNCCTQVFSQRLSSVMKLLARTSITGIEAQAAETADLLCFMDELFDSVNGGSPNPPPLKPLLCAVKPTSGHVEFWNEALKVLDSMAYTDGRMEGRTPSLVNWGRTIRNIKELWNRLRNSGFKYLVLRNLNQDPLENKFGAIRSHGFRNVVPTCSNFVGAYKSLLLNDMVAAHSVGANCEKDDCEVLDNLREYLGTQRGLPSIATHSASPAGIDVHLDAVVDAQLGGDNNEAPAGNAARLFSSISAGDFILKMGPVDCSECKNKQHTVNPHDGDALNTQREGLASWRWLQSPSDSFTSVYFQCRDVILRELPMTAHRPGIGSHLRNIISTEVDFSDITCEEHRANYMSKFCKYFVKYIIMAWCTSVNRYLSGKDSRVFVNMDVVHREALVYFKKKRRR